MALTKYAFTRISKDLVKDCQPLSKFLFCWLKIKLWVDEAGLGSV